MYTRPWASSPNEDRLLDLQRRPAHAARPAGARASRTRRGPCRSRRTRSVRGGRERAVAHDDAARDRAVARRVRAHDHRRDVAGGGLARRVARAALERRASRSSRRGPCRARTKSISSHCALADVADRQVAGAAVEGEAPRVAQAVGVDLAARARAARRTGCRAGTVYGVRRRLALGSIRRILPSSEPRFWALPRAAVLVAAAAAVARADVEQAVGAEQRAGRRCGWTRRRPSAARAAPTPGRRGRRRGACTRRSRWSPVAVGEVDVEQAARRVVGREGDREQALLAAAR